MRRVAHFPSISLLKENPYWSTLDSGLQSLGVGSVNEAEFSGRWLLRNRKQVDYLHFHYVQYLYAYQRDSARLRWVFRLARNIALARACGYRVIFTVHNLSPTYPLSPEPVDYLGHLLTIALANDVIVHCDYARAAVYRRYGRRRNVHVVCHPTLAGVYPNETTQVEARGTLGLPAEGKVFVFFGGIRPNKGIETLIEEFSAIEDGDYRLIVAGKPWEPYSYVSTLEEIAKKDERITVDARYVLDDEVQILLNSADAIVLPFKRILTSSSTILAMSFAKPVIAPAIGCLSELLGDGCGLLYDPQSPKELGNLMRKFSRDELKLMGEKAYSKVSVFTAERMARDTLAVYESH